MAYCRLEYRHRSCHQNPGPCFSQVRLTGHWLSVQEATLGGQVLVRPPQRPQASTVAMQVPGGGGVTGGGGEGEGEGEGLGDGEGDGVGEGEGMMAGGGDGEGVMTGGGGGAAVPGLHAHHHALSLWQELPLVQQVFCHRHTKQASREQQDT